MDQAVEADTGGTSDGQEDADAGCLNLLVEATPVDLYFMFDVSGSMEGTNITDMRSGFADFANGPESAGLGATAQRFPIPSAEGPDETCDQNAYAKPAVPWGLLPNAVLVSWVETLEAGGWTPTIPALTGAVRACDDRLAANPTHKCAVVLVTDGRPDSNCSPSGQDAEAPLGQVAASAWAAGIPVYAIGLPGLDYTGQAVLSTIAEQGGTGSPIILEGMSVSHKFSDALADIREAAPGCEYLMPSLPTGVDPSTVTVSYSSIMSAEEVLPQVADRTACAGDGWHHDDNASPSRIILCPFTCNKMRNDEGSKVTFSVGCSAST